MSKKIDEYNEYYYGIVKSLYEDYNRIYHKDPSNCIVYGDVQCAVKANKLNLAQYQKFKDYKKVCDDLIKEWNKLADCYYGYDDSDARDYRDAAMELEDTIKNTKLPNGESIIDPDGSRRRKAEEEYQKRINAPCCEKNINLMGLKFDIEEYGVEFVENYLTENYPTGEWRELFDAVVSNKEITDELKFFQMDKEDGVFVYDD